MYTSRLKEHYNKQSVKQLQEEFSYANAMELPKIEKIVLNMGLKDAVNDSKMVDQAVSEMFAITGQKPVVTKAKKSIAGFKLREGVAIGCKVTLRNHMMYDFLDRLINIALPRVKDFRGVDDRKFDRQGNFSFGIKEQIVFPEIEYDKIDKIRGFNIVIVTTAKNSKEAKSLLKTFNFPFVR